MNTNATITSEQLTQHTVATQGEVENADQMHVQEGAFITGSGSIFSLESQGLKPTLNIEKKSKLLATGYHTSGVGTHGSGGISNCREDQTEVHSSSGGCFTTGEKLVQIETTDIATDSDDSDSGYTSMEDDGYCSVYGVGKQCVMRFTMAGGGSHWYNYVLLKNMENGNICLLKENKDHPGGYWLQGQCLQVKLNEDGYDQIRVGPGDEDMDKYFDVSFWRKDLEPQQLYNVAKSSQVAREDSEDSLSGDDSEEESTDVSQLFEDSEEESNLKHKLEELEHKLETVQGLVKPLTECCEVVSSCFDDIDNYNCDEKKSFGEYLLDYDCEQLEKWREQNPYPNSNWVDMVPLADWLGFFKERGVQCNHIYLVLREERDYLNRITNLSSGLQNLLKKQEPDPILVLAAGGKMISVPKPPHFDAINGLIEQYKEATAEIAHHSFKGRGVIEYHMWAMLRDTPYSLGDVKLAGWNSKDDTNAARGEYVYPEPIIVSKKHLNRLRNLSTWHTDFGKWCRLSSDEIRDDFEKWCVARNEQVRRCKAATKIQSLSRGILARYADFKDYQFRLHGEHFGIAAIEYLKKIGKFGWSKHVDALYCERLLCGVAATREEWVLGLRNRPGDVWSDAVIKQYDDLAINPSERAKFAKYAWDTILCDDFIEVNTKLRDPWPFAYFLKKEGQKATSPYFLEDEEQTINPFGAAENSGESDSEDEGQCYDGKACQLDEFGHCVHCCECKQCIKLLEEEEASTEINAVCRGYLQRRDYDEVVAYDGEFSPTSEDEYDFDQEVDPHGAAENSGESEDDAEDDVEIAENPFAGWSQKYYTGLESWQHAVNNEHMAKIAAITEDGGVIGVPGLNKTFNLKGLEVDSPNESFESIGQLVLGSEPGTLAFESVEEQTINPFGAAENSGESDSDEDANPFGNADAEGENSDDDEVPSEMRLTLNGREYSFPVQNWDEFCLERKDPYGRATTVIQAIYRGHLQRRKMNWIRELLLTTDDDKLTQAGLAFKNMR